MKTKQHKFIVGHDRDEIYYIRYERAGNNWINMVIRLTRYQIIELRNRINEVLDDNSDSILS
jgi:hypothetical protein